MTQRSPNNERYREENRGGKTRKSAASAKPASERAATVHNPAPKSKKQKKAEARERERKQEQRYQVQVPDNKPIEQLPEYKKLRRIWWVCLGGAILAIAASLFVMSNEDFGFLYLPCLVIGYVLVIGAFYIDFRKIRKLRKQYEANVLKGKSKEARAQQKAARAEARLQKAEAEEKFAAAQAAEAEKKAKSPLNRLKSKFSGNSEPSTEAEAAEEGAASK